MEEIFWNHFLVKNQINFRTTGRLQILSCMRRLTLVKWYEKSQNNLDNLFKRLGISSKRWENRKEFSSRYQTRSLVSRKEKMSKPVEFTTQNYDTDWHVIRLALIVWQHFSSVLLGRAENCWHTFLIHCISSSFFQGVYCLFKWNLSSS